MRSTRCPAAAWRPVRLRPREGCALATSILCSWSLFPSGARAPPTQRASWGPRLHALLVPLRQRPMAARSVWCVFARLHMCAPVRVCMHACICTCLHKCVYACMFVVRMDVWACKSICAFVYVFVYVYMCGCACVCVCGGVYLCIYVHWCVCVCTHVHVYVWGCVYLCAYMCICVYVCTHACVHAHAPGIAGGMLAPLPFSQAASYNVFKYVQ